MFSQNIVEGDLSETKIWGYKYSKLKIFLTWTCYILSLFILRLVFHWLPRWYIIMSHTRCSLQEADVILCKDQYQHYWIHKLRNSLNDEKKTKNKGEDYQVDNEHYQSLRYFMHKKIKYIWDCKTPSFQKLQGLERSPCIGFYQTLPLTEIESKKKMIFYGKNSIDVKITPFLVLLFKEGLNPFYIFQVFSCTLWFLDQYTIYASCIVFMSALSLSIQLYQIRKNETTLRKTVGISGETIVCREEKIFQSINADQLVPGDIIEIPRTGCIMYCDAVLISGNCIVNESMLTGESVPVTKTPLPNPTGIILFTQDSLSPVNKSQSDNEELLDIKKHNRQVLFCGTNIIQANNISNESIMAVVVRTGFSTAKGELVRSILYPKPIDIKYHRDAMKFIMVLFLFALIGFVYSVIIMVQRNISIGKIIIRSLDLVTIVVPPALPIAMTIGIVFAQYRLKKKSIFCISPNTINICGGINVTCFDKTGTLTEDSLDLLGVVARKDDGTFNDLTADLKDLSSSHLVQGMATCHTLTFIEGKLCGDPLELEMFQSTDWLLKDTIDENDNVFEMTASMIAYNKVTEVNNAQKYSLAIMRKFPFISSLQRMTVITKASNNPYFDVYVKGSPEIILSLCLKETIPSNFNKELLEYTKNGYRVLSLAYRSMDISYEVAMHISRQDLECNLTFLGFLVWENKLKPETEKVITQIKDANIRPIMVTGDNMLTALSVSRDCGIIDELDSVILVDARILSDIEEVIVEFHYADDLQCNSKDIYVKTSEIGVQDTHTKINIFHHSKLHFAISGKSWNIIKDKCPQLIPKIITKGSVFARFAPEQKAQVIEALQSVGYYVSMCGDGANDCGALKVAHAGISLSETEASVASPFTSKVQNITCVPELIKEGRCALTTSFGTFKFMAGYSFTQFISVLILYWMNTNLGDYQFLYVDLILITTLSVTSSYTKAYRTLSVETPNVRLLTGAMISSLALQWSLNAAVQVSAYLYVRSYPWYFLPKEANDDIIHQTFAVTAVFLVSLFQYIILVVIFSKGPPFRARFYTNYIFVCNFVAALVLSLYIGIKPFEWLQKLLYLVAFPSLRINAILLSFAFGNFLISFLIEYFINNNFVRLQIFRLKVVLCSRLVTDVEHVRITEDIDKNIKTWPRIIMSTSVKDMRPEIFTDI